MRVSTPVTRHAWRRRPPAAAIDAGATSARRSSRRSCWAWQASSPAVRRTMPCSDRAAEIFESSDEMQRDPLLLGWAATRTCGCGKRMPAGAPRPRDHGCACANRLACCRGSCSTSRCTRHRRKDGGCRGRLPRSRPSCPRDGPASELAASLAGLARIEARLGKDDDASRMRRSTCICAELGIGTHELWALAALGELELTRGETLVAVAYFEEQQAAIERLGVADVDLWPTPDLVRRTCGSAPRRRARRTRAYERRRARRTDRGHSHACIVRGGCSPTWRTRRVLRGSVAPARTDQRPVRDRTHATRVRRSAPASRQRVRAREELASGNRSLRQIGAEPWVEQASAELAATGETARRRNASTLDALTPQELQIGCCWRRDGPRAKQPRRSFSARKQWNTTPPHLSEARRQLAGRAQRRPRVASPT